MSDFGTNFIHRAVENGRFLKQFWETFRWILQCPGNFGDVRMRFVTPTLHTFLRSLPAMQRQHWVLVGKSPLHCGWESSLLWAAPGHATLPNEWGHDPEIPLHREKSYSGNPTSTLQQLSGFGPAKLNKCGAASKVCFSHFS